MAEPNDAKAGTAALQLTVAVDCRMALHSGIGVVLRNTLGALVAARPQWRFRLLGAPADSDMPRGERIRHIAMTSNIYSIAEQFELRRLAAGADVVWSPHYNGAVLAPVPLVATIHDVTHLAMKEFTRAPHKRLYAELMYRSIAAKASALIFVSDFSRREFVRLVGRPAGRELIAHNAVSDAWLSVPHPAAAPSDYVVYVGNVKPHKNLQRLLEAMEIVRQQRDMSLVIVGKMDGFITGDNDASSALRARQDWVRVVEDASDADLRTVVAGARALAFPSLYEGFGLPPLEAMAAGCPAVVSTAASMPEVCGDAAVYFDPLDSRDMSRALLSVLTDPALRDKLIDKGRRHARRFSWQATAAVVADAIEQAAAR